MLDSEGDIAAEAEDVMVLFDFAKNEKLALPQWMLDNIATLEQAK